jgi:type III secretion system HrpE/YscL family protein
MSENIVKVHSSHAVSHGARISRAVREASLDATEIVAQAKAEAAEILAIAEREKEKLFEESRQRGYKDGLDNWNERLAEAWQARDQYLAKNEGELVKLAVAVARRIVGECAAMEPDAVLPAVREALRSVPSERKIRLRVSTTDAATVQKHIGELSALSWEICEIKVITDDSIELGGCIVESDLGVIDAQFSTQLDSLERALLRGTHAGGH